MKNNNKILNLLFTQKLYEKNCIYKIFMVLNIFQLIHFFS